MYPPPRPPGQRSRQRDRSAGSGCSSRKLETHTPAFEVIEDDSETVAWVGDIQKNNSFENSKMRSECICHKCKAVAIKSDGWVDGSQFRSATNRPPHQMQDEKLSGTNNVVIMCYGTRGKQHPRGSVITPMDTNAKGKEAEGWSSEESRGIANEGRLKQRETNAGGRIGEKIRSSDPLQEAWKLITVQGRCEKSTRPGTRRQGEFYPLILIMLNTHLSQHFI